MDVHDSSHDSDTITSGQTEPSPSPIKPELAEHVKEHFKAFYTTQDKCCEDEVQVDDCTVGLVTEAETDCPFILSSDDSEAKENVEVNTLGITMSRKRGRDSDVIAINLDSDEDDDKVKQGERTALRKKRKKYRRNRKSSDFNQDHPASRHKYNSYEDDCGINADDECDDCETPPSVSGVCVLCDDDLINTTIPPKKPNVPKPCCCGKCSEEHINSHSQTFVDSGGQGIFVDTGGHGIFVDTGGQGTFVDTGGQGTLGLGACYGGWEYGCGVYDGYSTPLYSYADCPVVRCCGPLYSSSALGNHSNCDNNVPNPLRMKNPE